MGVLQSQHDSGERTALQAELSSRLDIACAARPYQLAFLQTVSEVAIRLHQAFTRPVFHSGGLLIMCSSDRVAHEVSRLLDALIEISLKPTLLLPWGPR